MPTLLDNPWGREVYDLAQEGDGYAGFYKWAMDGMLPGVDPLNEPSINANIWQRQVTSADQFNNSGYFTALIGYMSIQDRAYTSPIWYTPPPEKD